MSLKQQLREQGYLKEEEVPFEELQEGEHFFNSEGTKFIKMPQGFDPDWPLANARRESDPHLRGSFGPWAGVRKERATVDQNSRPACANYNRAWPLAIGSGQVKYLAASFGKNAPWLIVTMNPCA